VGQSAVELGALGGAVGGGLEPPTGLEARSSVGADLGFRRGAGDGNRTRTVSLGIRQIRSSDRPDLGTRCTASDRHRPCDTGVNGPLMARGLMTLEGLAPAAGFTTLAVSLAGSGRVADGRSWGYGGE